jgi:hypothetical protein
MEVCQHSPLCIAQQFEFEIFVLYQSVIPLGEELSLLDSALEVPALLRTCDGSKSKNVYSRKS